MPRQDQHQSPIDELTQPSQLVFSTSSLFLFMAGLETATAILGVAEIGLALSRTLITVIGDYRDAAVNINRLRDELHLTSICLQQIGDLAQENRLIPGRGVLEATNLQERCRAVIWEIRTVIKKGDNPLHPQEITKDDIDVTYFTAWKWALWTKKHLEEPRLELDRLKDSMTLTFVTHMAILATSDFERSRYASQIPGIKRKSDWAEQDWRNDRSGEQPLVPQEIIDAGPEVWQEFMLWKSQPSPSGSGQLQQLQAAGLSEAQISALLTGPSPKLEYQAWSLDPFVGRVQFPITDQWLKESGNQSSEKMWDIHSKLQPWYKNQLDELTQELKATTGSDWTLVSLKLIRRSFFRRVENPPSVQAVVKGLRPRMEAVVYSQPTMRIARPEVVTYSEQIDVEDSKTDEELIREQLEKYQASDL